MLCTHQVGNGNPKRNTTTCTRDSLTISQSVVVARATNRKREPRVERDKTNYTSLANRRRSYTFLCVRDNIDNVFANTHLNVSDERLWGAAYWLDVLFVCVRQARSSLYAFNNIQQRSAAAAACSADFHYDCNAGCRRTRKKRDPK